MYLHTYQCEYIFPQLVNLRDCDLEKRLAYSSLKGKRTNWRILYKQLHNIPTYVSQTFRTTVKIHVLEWNVKAWYPGISWFELLVYEDLMGSSNDKLYSYNLAQEMGWYFSWWLWPGPVCFFFFCRNLGIKAATGNAIFLPLSPWHAFFVSQMNRIKI